MKAKVIATGDVIDVVKDWDNVGGVVYVGYADKDGNFYQENELELNPDTHEKVIEGWVARDKCGPTDLGLRIYTAYPRRMEGLKRWNGREAKSVLIDHRLFPEVTWESEPLKVKLTITPME